MHNDLRLYQQVLLIALHNERGTIAAPMHFRTALGCALLADLLIEDRLTLADPKKRIIAVRNDSPTRDPLLDQCIEKVGAAKRPAAAEVWIGVFASIRHAMRTAALSLCDRGILREEERSVLLLFKRRVYTPRRRKPEREIVDRLRRAIFTTSHNVTARTKVLVGICNRTGLLKVPFDRRDLRERKDRIKQLSDTEQPGRHTIDGQDTLAQITAVLSAALRRKTATAYADG